MEIIMDLPTIAPAKKKELEKTIQGIYNEGKDSSMADLKSWLKKKIELCQSEYNNSARGIRYRENMQLSYEIYRDVLDHIEREK